MSGLRTPAPFPLARIPGKVFRDGPRQDGAPGAGGRMSMGLLCTPIRFLDPGAVSSPTAVRTSSSSTRASRPNSAISPATSCSTGAGRARSSRRRRPERSPGFASFNTRPAAEPENRPIIAAGRLRTVSGIRTLSSRHARRIPKCALTWSSATAVSARRFLCRSFTPMPRCSITSSSTTIRISRTWIFAPTSRQPRSTSSGRGPATRCFCSTW
jgi:hypothetical protein